MLPRTLLLLSLALHLSGVVSTWRPYRRTYTDDVKGHYGESIQPHRPNRFESRYREIVTQRDKERREREIKRQQQSRPIGHYSESIQPPRPNRFESRDREIVRQRDRERREREIKRQQQKSLRPPAPYYNQRDRTQRNPRLPRPVKSDVRRSYYGNRGRPPTPKTPTKESLRPPAPYYNQRNRMQRNPRLPRPVKSDVRRYYYGNRARPPTPKTPTRDLFKVADASTYGRLRNLPANPASEAHIVKSIQSPRPNRFDARDREIMRKRDKERRERQQSHIVGSIQSPRPNRFAARDEEIVRQRDKERRERQLERLKNKPYKPHIVQHPNRTRPNFPRPPIIRPVRAQVIYSSQQNRTRLNLQRPTIGDLSQVSDLRDLYLGPEDHRKILVKPLRKANCKTKRSKRLQKKN